jgi:hypothetical protein
MCHEYVERVGKLFAVSDDACRLFARIANTPTSRRAAVLSDFEKLKAQAGLAYALLALYRQQVTSGFVLADPLKAQSATAKEFYDHSTGITFRLRWNPHRELRKNHKLLIERQVIAADIDRTLLVNPDPTGKACYLCPRNINLQNPGEVLVEIRLAGEKFYAGANFAYITNNHYTLINAQHRPQHYREQVPAILSDFVDQSGGFFRAIFNGLAGATIEWHEHMQATTEPFPIEQIRVLPKDVIHEANSCRVSQPFYYVPLWLIEGTDRERCERAADALIRRWQGMDENKHTVNIIVAKSDRVLRIFVVLRDRDKLAGDSAGKKGAMAAFETGGNIILSYEPPHGEDGVNERRTFDAATLETVKQLLYQVCPNQESCAQLRRETTANLVGI